MFFLHYLMELIPAYMTCLILTLGVFGVGPVSWAKDFHNSFDQEMEELQRVVNETFSDNKLSLDHIKDPDHLKRGLKDLIILERAKQKSEQRLNNYIKVVKSKMETSFKPYCIGEFAKGFFYGFNESFDEYVLVIKEFYRIQKDLTHVLEERFLFLQSVQEDFWKEDDMIVFATDELLDKYNEFYLGIIKLAEMEKNVVDKINKREFGKK